MVLKLDSGLGSVFSFLEVAAHLLCVTITCSVWTVLKSFSNWVDVLANKLFSAASNRWIISDKSGEEVCVGGGGM